MRQGLERNVFIYLGTGVVNRALPFLLLPLLTKYLSPADYGYLTVLTTLLLFALPFIGMSLHTNIERNFYSAQDQRSGPFVAELLLILTINVAAAYALMLALRPWIAAVSFGLPWRWFYLVPAVVFFRMIIQFALTIFRCRDQAMRYGTVEVLYTAFELILCVVFVVGCGMGWEGRAHSFWISSLVCGVLCLSFLIRSGYVRRRPDPHRIRDIFQVSLPLIPYSLGAVIILYSDRLFIDRMVGKSAVGIYAVGYAFGMLVAFVKDAFARAWSPWVYRQLADLTPQRQREIVRHARNYMAGMLIGSAVFAVLCRYLLPLMVNERYYGAARYVVWLAPAQAFNAMYSLFVPFWIYAKKTRTLAMIMLTASAVNVLGNYWLIGRYGPVGAAQATLAAFITGFGLIFFYTRRLCPLPWFGREQARTGGDPV